MVDDNVDDIEKVDQIEKVYEQLIDEYLKEVSKDQLLEKGIDRKKIIEEACATIRAKLSHNYPQL